MKTRISSRVSSCCRRRYRERDSVEPGDAFEVERLDRGEYRLVRLTAPPKT